MFHDYDWLLQSVLHRSSLAYYSILLFETPVIQAENIFKHLIKSIGTFYLGQESDPLLRLLRTGFRLFSRPVYCLTRFKKITGRHCRHCAKQPE